MRGEDCFQQPAGRAKKLLVQTPELEAGISADLGGVRGEVIFLSEVEESHAVGEPPQQVGHAFEPIGPAERTTNEPRRLRTRFHRHRQQSLPGHEVAYRRGKPRNLAGEVILADQHVASVGDGFLQ